VPFDLDPTPEQDELVRTFSSLLAVHSTPEAVRRAEQLGHDPSLWSELVQLGAVVMGVPEHDGGWGATLLDLTLVAEELGRACAPVPAVEAQVAARTLAAAGGAATAEALGRILAGESLVTIALHPARGGVAAMVPGGAVCDALLVVVDGRLVLVEVDEGRRRPIANLAGAPFADVELGDGTLVADGSAAEELFQVALDEWMVLTAGALVGLSDAALGLACGHASERHAFGRPIGAYQAISHRLADDVTAVEGARLLARKAAWCLDGDGARGRELAAMAFAFASEAAEVATYDALHTHGGYGFTVEYDVQLHHRRARGWPRAWGGAPEALARVAEVRYPPEAVA